MPRVADLLGRLGVPPGSGASIALALAVLAVAMAVVARSDRRLLRSPVYFLIAYLVVLGGQMALPDSPPAGLVLELLALLFLLASIGRSLFLIGVQLAVRRRGRPLPRILEDLIQLGVYLAIAFVVLRAAGVEPGSLLTTSALLTAVIGLSLQDTLGNLFAGLAIQAQHPFGVGDWIQFEDDPRLTGRVLEINWRATRMLTIERFEVVVPNSTLAKAPIRNYTKPDGIVRRQAEVVAPYSAPPSQVRALLEEIARDIPGVCVSPAPTAIILDFNERGVQYAIRYFINDFSRREMVAGAVRERIWYALGRASWEIPPPRRYIELGDRSAHAAEQRDRQIARRRAAIAAVDLFTLLGDEARDALAERATTRLYSDGEVIIRQGDPGDELFVIEHGSVSVLLARGGGTPQAVATLGPGRFFGEMSLMTGEPRRATVRANGECEVVVVGKEAFGHIIEANTELAERISAALATRDEDLETSSLDDAAGTESERPSQQLILDRIRRFFSLKP